MKKVFVLISCSLFAISALAQNSKQYNTNRNDSVTGMDSAQTYCVYKKENGKLCVKKEGQELTSNVSLSDGSTLKPDGTLIKKDGTKKTLKEDECVNKDGNLSRSDKTKITEKSGGY